MSLYNEPCLVKNFSTLAKMTRTGDRVWTVLQHWGRHQPGGSKGKRETEDHSKNIVDKDRNKAGLIGSHGGGAEQRVLVWERTTLGFDLRDWG